MAGDRPRETGVPFGLLRRREPTARLLRVARGLSLVAVGLLAAVGCGQPPAAPTPVPPLTQEPSVELITYTGVVFEPQSSKTGRYWNDHGITPIPGARVTIVGGQPDGWTAVTDAEGRYAFEDYPKCKLESVECYMRRFRVEKAGYETRELGASDPYRYISKSDGDREYSAFEKRIPMGREWPRDPQIQRMLRDLPAVSPLFLLERPDHRFAGSYVGLVIRVRSLEMLNTIGHEYCHAHQAWVLDFDRPGLDAVEYERSPEGLAFVAAWEADSPTNDELLRWVEIHSDRAGKSPTEEAAEICSHYFVDHWFYSTGAQRVTVGRAYLRDHLPHLHAWGEEWLRHP